MRRVPLLSAILVLAACAVEARAQNLNNSFGFTNDPFALYYGFYLPRQAALAAQPGPEATLNQIVAERQQYAVTNRSTLYDPASPYGSYTDGPDFLAREGQRGGGRSGRASSRGLPTTSLRGTGPAGYYNRANAYYPMLRNGQGQNMNLANIQPRGRGGRSVGSPNAQAGMRPGIPR